MRVYAAVLAVCALWLLSTASAQLTVEGPVCAGYAVPIRVARTEAITRSLSPDTVYWTKAADVPADQGVGANTFKLRASNKIISSSSLPSARNTLMHFETRTLDPASPYSIFLCRTLSVTEAEITCAYRLDLKLLNYSDAACAAAHPFTLSNIPLQLVLSYPNVGINAIIVSHLELDAVNVAIDVASVTRSTEAGAANASLKILSTGDGLKLHAYLKSPDPKFDNPGLCPVDVFIPAGAEVGMMSFRKLEGRDDINVTGDFNVNTDTLQVSLVRHENCSLSSINNLLRTEMFTKAFSSWLIKQISGALIGMFRQFYRSWGGYIAQDPCFQAQFFSGVQEINNEVKFSAGIKSNKATPGALGLALKTDAFEGLLGGAASVNNIFTSVNIDGAAPGASYNPDAMVNVQAATSALEAVVLGVKDPVAYERFTQFTSRATGILSSAIGAFSAPDFMGASFFCSATHPYWTCNRVTVGIKDKVVGAITGYLLGFGAAETVPQDWHMVPLLSKHEAERACEDQQTMQKLVNVNADKKEEDKLIAKITKNSKDAVTAARKRISEIVSSSSSSSSSNVAAALGREDNRVLPSDVPEGPRQPLFAELQSKVQVGQWALQFIHNLTIPLSGMPIAKLVVKKVVMDSLSLGVTMSQIDAHTTEFRVSTIGQQGVGINAALAVLTKATEEASDDLSKLNLLLAQIKVAADTPLFIFRVKEDPQSTITISTVDTHSAWKHKVTVKTDWDGRNNANWAQRLLGAVAGDVVTSLANVLIDKFLPPLFSYGQTFVANAIKFAVSHPCIQANYLDVDPAVVRPTKFAFIVTLNQGTLNVDLDFREYFTSILRNKLPQSVQTNGLHLGVLYSAVDTLRVDLASGLGVPYDDWNTFIGRAPSLIGEMLNLESVKHISSSVGTLLELLKGATDPARQFWKGKNLPDPLSPTVIEHTQPFLHRACEHRSWLGAVKGLAASTLTKKDDLTFKYTLDRLGWETLQLAQLNRAEELDTKSGQLAVATAAIEAQKLIVEKAEKLVADTIANNANVKSLYDEYARLKAKHTRNPFKALRNAYRKWNVKRDLKKATKRHQGEIDKVLAQQLTEDKVLRELVEKADKIADQMMVTATKIEEKNRAKQVTTLKLPATASVADRAEFGPAKVYGPCRATTDQVEMEGFCLSIEDCRRSGYEPKTWREGAFGCTRFGIHVQCCVKEPGKGPLRVSSGIPGAPATPNSPAPPKLTRTPSSPL